MFSLLGTKVLSGAGKKEGKNRREGRRAEGPLKGGDGMNQEKAEPWKDPVHVHVCAYM